MIIFWFKRIGIGNKIAVILEKDINNAWKILSDTVECSDVSRTTLSWSLVDSISISTETGLIACFNMVNENSLSLYDPPLN